MSHVPTRRAYYYDTVLEMTTKVSWCSLTHCADPSQPPRDQGAVTRPPIAEVGTAPRTLARRYGARSRRCAFYRRRTRPWHQGAIRLVRGPVNVQLATAPRTAGASTGVLHALQHAQALMATMKCRPQRTEQALSAENTTGHRGEHHRTPNYHRTACMPQRAGEPAREIEPAITVGTSRDGCALHDAEGGDAARRCRASGGGGGCIGGVMRVVRGRERQHRGRHEAAAGRRPHRGAREGASARR